MLTLLAVSASLSSVSCSKDDEPKEEGGTSVSASYVISKITMWNDYYDKDQVTDLHYDSKGRFAYSSGDYFDWLDYTPEYKSNDILCKDRDGDFVLKVEKGIIQGFQDLGEDSMYYRFFYEDKNHLSSMGFVSGAKISLTWDGDKISKVKDEEGNLKSVQYLASSSIDTSAAKIINALAISDFVEDEYCWIYAQNGYLGVVPSLPISKIGTNEIIYGTLDGNNCPSSVKFIDNNNNHTNELKFEWKKL